MSTKQLGRVVITYPSGNTTAIVVGDLSGYQLERINAQLMSWWKCSFPQRPEIEQCAYFSTDAQGEPRLELFGGEFCGNAARSGAILMMQGKDTTSPQDIRVSGVNHPLKFQLRKGIVTIEMPLPSLSKECITQVEEGYLVKLDGIVHLVMKDSAQNSRKKLSNLIRSGKYGIDKCNAFGVCKSEKAEFCVWVREMGSIFDETACGSGTCAISLVKAYEQSESIEGAVIQPSGERIIAKVSWDDKKQKAISASISGKVEILYDGPVSL